MTSVFQGRQRCPHKSFKITRGFPFTNCLRYSIISPFHAGVMELADVMDSKSIVGNNVPVRVRPPAPNQYNPNQSRQIIPVGDGFGLLLFFDKFECPHFPNGVIKRSESKPKGPRKEERTIAIILNINAKRPGSNDPGLSFYRLLNKSAPGGDNVFPRLLF